MRLLLRVEGEQADKQRIGVIIQRRVCESLSGKPVHYSIYSGHFRNTLPLSIQ